VTTTVVNGNTPFGQISNQIPKTIYFLDDYINRLSNAVSVAEAGYSGIAGAEFENSTFGVQQSGATGAKGSDWSFAVGTLATAWATFMSGASGAINTLDNGTT
jgi:hypothetical protein